MGQVPAQLRCVPTDQPQSMVWRLYRELAMWGYPWTWYRSSSWCRMKQLDCWWGQVAKSIWHLYWNICWLPICCFRVLVLIHKALDNLGPGYLEDLQSFPSCYRIPIWAFGISGSMLWNIPRTSIIRDLAGRGRFWRRFALGRTCFWDFSVSIPSYHRMHYLIVFL